jgi:hypothetical protein
LVKAGAAIPNSDFSRKSPSNYYTILRSRSNNLIEQIVDTDLKTVLGTISCPNKYKVV